MSQFDRAYIKARIQQYNELFGYTDKENPNRIPILKSDSDEDLLEKLSSALSAEMDNPDTPLLSDDAPVELLEFAIQLGLVPDTEDDDEEDDEESGVEDDEESGTEDDEEVETAAIEEVVAPLSDYDFSETSHADVIRNAEKEHNAVQDTPKDKVAILTSRESTPVATKVAGFITPDMPLLVKARLMESAFAMVLETIAHTDKPVTIILSTDEPHPSHEVANDTPAVAVPDTADEVEQAAQPAAAEVKKTRVRSAGKTAEEIATAEIKARLRQGGDLQNKAARIAYLTQYGIKTKGDPEKLTKSALQQIIVKHYVKSKVASA